MNVVALAGNVCFDPELRFTAGGTAVCNFRLAVNRSKDETDFIDVIAFNSKSGSRLAERCAEWLQKGSKVAVNGRWQVRQWEDKDGNRRYSHECVANQVDFLANTKSREEQAQQTSYTPRANTGQVQEVDPNDIPF